MSDLSVTGLYTIHLHPIPLSSHQVIHHPKQVKTPDELQVGKTYVSFHGNMKVWKYLVIKILPDGWVLADQIIDRNVYSDMFSMRDKGILPYENGKWNPSNWLIPEEVYVEERN